MLIFGNDQHARGCFREVMSAATQIKTAAYLTIGSDTYPTVSGGSAAEDTVTPFFISGVDVTQKEKYAIIPCFGDRNYLYAFGHDASASMLEITFTMFLTDVGGTSFGNSLKTLTAAYAKSRLSQNPNYSYLTVGSANYKGFIVGMSTGTADPEHNLQSFRLFMLALEIQDGGSKSNG